MLSRHLCIQENRFTSESQDTDTPINISWCTTHRPTNTVTVQRTCSAVDEAVLDDIFATELNNQRPQVSDRLTGLVVALILVQYVHRLTLSVLGDIVDRLWSDTTTFCGLIVKHRHKHIRLGRMNTPYRSSCAGPTLTPPHNSGLPTSFFTSKSTLLSAGTSLKVQAFGHVDNTDPYMVVYDGITRMHTTKYTIRFIVS